MPGRASRQKGDRAERKTIAYLEARGYSCCRAAGSLGAWDVIAVGSLLVRLIQVTCNRRKGPADRATLASFVVPPAFVVCEMWMWTDRENHPVILRWSNQQRCWLAEVEI